MHGFKDISPAKNTRLRWHEVSVMPNSGFPVEAGTIVSVARQIFPCLACGNGAETGSHRAETGLIAVKKAGAIPAFRAASASLQVDP